MAASIGIGRSASTSALPPSNPRQGSDVLRRDGWTRSTEATS